MFERLTPLRDHIAQIIAGQGSKSSTSLLILAVISVLLRLRKAIRNKKAAKAWREVQGKTAVVTGGSSGIGQEVVRLLSAKSFNVAILDLAAPPTNSVGSRNVRYFKTDVSDPDSVQKACAAVHAAFGKVDVLVNNVSIPWNHLLHDPYQPTCVPSFSRPVWAMHLETFSPPISIAWAQPSRSTLSPCSIPLMPSYPTCLHRSGGML